MIISEKQIIKLISIAEQAVALDMFDGESKKAAMKFLLEIREQQSDELREIE